MAEFIDDQVDETLQEGEEFNNFDETPEEDIVEEEVAEQDEPEEDDLPDKYRNKSVKDIVQMHKEAEKLLGRQSSEVGELRKLVDNFILSQQTASTKEEAEEDIDFFDDPKKAVEAAISKHPKIRAAEQMEASYKQQAALSKLQSEHPDFQDILGDGNFEDWIKGSKVRMELFHRADSRYDYDAANELLSNWKERSRVIQKTKEVEDVERKRQRKAASTGAGRGSGESSSRKVYRRTDIIKLMQNDPARYLDLADEITLAYQEGRVK